MIHKALTIAGFDSSGGAGLQADLKTFAAFGCYGMSILTALPIQNTCGVKNCYPIPIQAIREQLDIIFDDIPPHSIKIGMLFSEEIVTLVADFLKKISNIPIVLDPVMRAKSGDRLLLVSAIQAIQSKLIPLVDILTPNIPEAEILANIKINDKNDMLLAGKIILDLGAKSVLVKGGHLLDGGCDDLLLTQQSYEWLYSKKIDTINNHGTGCTLSAAIAACLAQNISLNESCKIAKKYITNALLAYKDAKIGNGHGSVHHFYHLWPTIQLLYDTDA